jgi:hypothetical protein
MAPVVRPVVHADRTLVARVLAGHEQAVDAVPAHAAECHGTDWLVILGNATS